MPPIPLPNTDLEGRLEELLLELEEAVEAGDQDRAEEVELELDELAEFVVWP